MNDTMLISDDLKKELWKVPVGIDLIKDTGISHAAFRLYLNLLGYARSVDTCFPSRERLSEDIGCTVKNIDRLKNELKKIGLLDWKSTPGKDGRDHNTYVLLKYRPIGKTRGDKNVLPRGTKMSRYGGHECPSNNTNSKNTKKKNKYNIRDCDAWDEPTFASRVGNSKDRTTSGTEGFEADDLDASELNTRYCFTDVLEAEEEEEQWFMKDDILDGPALRKDVDDFIGIYNETRTKLGLRKLKNMTSHIQNIYSASYDDVKWYLEDETRFSKFFEYCDDRSYDMTIRSWECNSMREPTVMVNESVLRRYKDWLEGGHLKNKVRMGSARKLKKGTV